MPLHSFAYIGYQQSDYMGSQILLSLEAKYDSKWLIVVSSLPAMPLPSLDDTMCARLDV